MTKAKQKAAKKAKPAKPRGVWVMVYEWRGGSKLSPMWFVGATGCSEREKLEVFETLSSRRDVRNITGPVFIPFKAVLS